MARERGESDAMEDMMTDAHYRRLPRSALAVPSSPSVPSSVLPSM